MVYRQLASDEPRATAHLALVARLGATAGHPAPVLSATSAEFAASHRHVPAGRSPFAVLHPGACDPTRRWPAKRFAALGRHLTDWLAVVVTGSTAERELVHAVAAGMPGAQVCNAEGHPRNGRQDRGPHQNTTLRPTPAVTVRGAARPQICPAAGQPRRAVDTRTQAI